MKNYDHPLCVNLRFVFICFRTVLFCDEVSTNSYFFYVLEIKTAKIQ